MNNSREGIRVDQLSKHFGSRGGVQDISFEIPAGSICGLVGPNGARNPGQEIYDRRSAQGRNIQVDS